MSLESSAAPELTAPVAVAPAQPLNQRYLRWVDRVRSGLSALGGDAELVTSLESLASMDDSSIRTWLTDFEARHGLQTKDRSLEENSEINSLMHSTITEKERLLRFGVPRAAAAFIDSKRKLQTCNDVLLSGDESSIVASVANNSVQSTFLDALTAGCEFADAISELHRVMGNDGAKLFDWRVKETAKAVERQASVDAQRRRQELLKDDASGQWLSNVDSVRAEIASTSEQLRESDAEVRRLREALAAAEQKRYTLAKSLRSLSESAQTVSSRKRLLQFVTDVRVDLETCSKETAEQRLKVIDSIDSYRSVVQHKIVEDEFVNEVPILFDRLLTSLSGMKALVESTNNSADITGAKSVTQQLVQLIRVGIELVRLWRQLHGTWAPREITLKISAFEDKLRKEHADLIEAEHYSDAEACKDDSPQLTYSNSTVFLFFNHLCHDTPAGHIESRQRLDTVVDLVQKREQLDRAVMSRRQSSASGSGDDRNVDSLCDGVRQLQILPCPDATRPPEWVLPLVHAPSYLRMLQGMQDEAARDDLLVPLEFESDNYESDEDDSSIVAARDKALANMKSEPSSAQVAAPPTAGSGHVLLDTVKLGAEDDPYVELFENFVPKSEVDGGRGIDLDVPTDLINSVIREMEGPALPLHKQRRSGVDLSTDSYAFSSPVKTSRRGKWKRLSAIMDDDNNDDAGAIDESARPKYFRRKKWAELQSQAAESGNIIVKPEEEAAPVMPMHELSNEAVLKFVEKAVAYAGTQRKIADFIGVGPSFMSQWYKTRRNNDLTKFFRIETLVRSWVGTLTTEERETFMATTSSSSLPSTLKKKVFTPPAIASQNVLTPYGTGTVVESMTPVFNEYAPAVVQLEWGAKAYMNPAELEQVVTADVASPEVKKAVVPAEDLTGTEVKPRAATSGPNPYDNIFLDLMMHAITRTRKKMSHVHSELEQHAGFKMNRSYLSHWKHGLLTPRILHRIVPYIASWLLISKNALSPSQQEELDRITLKSIDTFPEFSEIYAKALGSLLHAIEVGKYQYPYVVFKPSDASIEGENADGENNSAVDYKPPVPIIPIDYVPKKRGRPRKKLRTEPVVVSSGGASFLASLSPKLAINFGDDNKANDDAAPSTATPPMNLQMQAIAGLFSLKIAKMNKSNDASNIDREGKDAEIPQKRDRDESDEDSGADSDSQSEGDSDDESSATATAVSTQGGSQRDERTSVDEPEKVSRNVIEVVEDEDLSASDNEERMEIDNAEADEAAVSVNADVQQMSGDETVYDANCTKNVEEDFDFEPPASEKWVTEVRSATRKPSQDDDDEGSVSDATMSEVSEDGSDDEFSHRRNSNSAVIENNGDRHEADPPASAVVVADAYNPNKHFGQCEACKKPGRLLLCDGCPCTYHLRCIVPKIMSVPDNDWYCTRCVESGASLKLEIPDSEKNESLCNSWILIFLKSLKKWVPAYVVTYSAKRDAFFCEYWRETKFKRTKLSQWLDISGCTVLRPSTLIASESRGFDLDSQPRKPATRTKTIDGAVDQLEAMVDTYIGPDSFSSALCASAVACRAVDVVMKSSNTNAFACIRPPGHHAGRYGYTRGCMSTGFCLLNNAAIAMVYSRVHWGLQRVAVIDIDVHFGNGTAELLRGDPMAFFACIHMIHGEENKGFRSRGIKRGPYADTSPTYEQGFYPNQMGTTEVSDRYMSIGVYPKRFGYLSKPNQNMTDECDAFTSFSGPDGFKYALVNIVIPRLVKYDPELLIISAGFDGFQSDPIGGDLGLTLNDYTFITNQLRGALERPGSAGRCRIVSLMEGGYDTNPSTLGLAVCVDNHVAALQGKNK